MGGPAVEVADVFRRYGAEFRRALGSSLSSAQRRVMAAIGSCRSAALGGHVDICSGCGHQAISYNSCRDRHCPKCQAAARAAWLRARQAELLAVPYFHVVFTLPDALSHVTLNNKRAVYDLLFRAASRSLLTIARDTRHLGASIGFLAILHTWGQTLVHHPHLHCVVPAGGLSGDRKRWIASRPRFFLPVRVLSRLFRRLFLAGLSDLHAQGRLQWGDSSSPHDPASFAAFVSSLRRTEWVVYSKPPFGGPDHVLAYLGRYTHRVAISNDRLVAADNGSVDFRYKDYRQPHLSKVLSLPAAEFIRRFLLHVLPRRFSKIRYFGIFANRQRAANIALCRSLLPRAPAPAPTAPGTLAAPASPRSADTDTVDPRPICSLCGSARLVRLTLPPAPSRQAALLCVPCDSS